MSQSPLKKSMTVCLCAALCAALPQALRVIPGTDGIYGLLHMPVLLCAFACGIGGGVACAFMGLTVSFLVTGLPSAVMLPVLLLECIAGTLLAAFMKRMLPFTNTERDISLCFAVSILLGRLAGGGLSALLFMAAGLPAAFWTGGYFLVSVPGMLIEMVLLPIVAYALANAGLIELSVRPKPADENTKS